jgi:hypothetical protein
MTTYHQNMTTVYNRKDLAIMSLERISEPQLAELDVQIYRLVWDKVLKPDSNTSGTNLTMINAVTFGTAWVLRLYDDLFPGDVNSPVIYLQNWMAIPLQFTGLCLQYANYTAEPIWEGLSPCRRTPQQRHGAGDPSSALSARRGRCGCSSPRPQPW